MGQSGVWPPEASKMHIGSGSAEEALETGKSNGYAYQGPELQPKAEKSFIKLDILLLDNFVCHSSSEMGQGLGTSGLGVITFKSGVYKNDRSSSYLSATCHHASYAPSNPQPN